MRPGPTKPTDSFFAAPGFVANCLMMLTYSDKHSPWHDASVYTLRVNSCTAPSSRLRRVRTGQASLHVAAGGTGTQYNNASHVI
jgi:hypothetical protein